ncbi:MAG TPA: hypothetical protein VFH70_04830 [Acidimicrobiales bacterium]|nr:hypothetical protein [Acidimicrobiales bacterium]
MRRLGATAGALAAMMLLEALLIGGVPAAWGLPGPWHPGDLARAVTATDPATALVAPVWVASMLAGAWIAAGLAVALMSGFGPLGTALGLPLPRWVLPLSLQQALGLPAGARSPGAGPAVGAVPHLANWRRSFPAGAGAASTALPPAAGLGLPRGFSAVWTVSEGDSFWSIAEVAWRRANGSEPAPHELASYWLAVVDANRSRLLRPGDPEMLVPGQVLVLPPLGDEDGAETARD